MGPQIGEGGVAYILGGVTWPLKSAFCPLECMIAEDNKSFFHWEAMESATNEAILNETLGNLVSLS